MKVLKTEGLGAHNQLSKEHKSENKNNKRNNNKEHLSTKDIEELMSHSCYKRSGRAFKQIK